MLFNVSQLMREPSGSIRRFDFENEQTTVELDGGEQIVVSGTVSLLRTDKGVWVSAPLISRITCECSRCLDSAVVPIEVMIEEEFLPVVDVLTGARIASPEDDEESFYIDQAHILDLNEAVRQYVSMNIPMRPLCSPDCAGICVACGVNLNHSLCECERRAMDPRWGSLLEIAKLSPSSN